MPMRDSASYRRPRLYDEDDPEQPDDVGLVMDALGRELEEAMDSGDSDRVHHIKDLMSRVDPSRGGHEHDGEKAEA